MFNLNGVHRNLRASSQRIAQHLILEMLLACVLNILELMLYAQLQRNSLWEDLCICWGIYNDFLSAYYF
jgi:hypothetical protein